ncbi:MAG: TIGR01440 family protein [Clostridia bacterium]|nr:TIGR01440 family protein [Clostridia bacterium]
MNTEFKLQAYTAAKELIAFSKLKEGDLLVVGCSSSEVLGEKIGTHSALEVGAAIAEGIGRACKEAGVFYAAQCCEHLNRALILERKAAERRGYSIVNVLPQPKAGGSFATAAFAQMEEPVAVEQIAAEAGMDIGGTLIGMHLKPVAVPVRLSQKTIGEAILLAARTRPKFIGGARAVYDEEKM